MHTQLCPTNAHTETHITHPVRSTMLMMDCQTHQQPAYLTIRPVRLFKKKKGYESEYPYALHVISALSRRVNMKQSLE